VAGLGVATQHVRPATVDDAIAIGKVHVRGWQGAYRGMLPDDFLDTMQAEQRAVRWKESIESEVLSNGWPAPTVYVCERDDGIVGFLCVGVDRDALDDPSAGELWAIYVDPDVFGSGAGYALMQTAIEHFRAASIAKASLWVFDENDLARRFYERQGWTAEDDVITDSIAGTELISRRYSIRI